MFLNFKKADFCKFREIGEGAPIFRFLKIYKNRLFWNLKRPICFILACEKNGIKIFSAPQKMKVTQRIEKYELVGRGPLVFFDSLCNLYFLRRWNNFITILFVRKNKAFTFFKIRKNRIFAFFEKPANCRAFAENLRESFILWWFFVDLDFNF